METIDLNRIRESLPQRAEVELRKQSSVGGSIPYIRIFVPEPSLSEEDFEMVKNWQRDIIGSENLSEFYTEETGRLWLIYLKRKPLEFVI